jgi:hypothetical protein
MANTESIREEVNNAASQQDSEDIEFSVEGDVDVEIVDDTPDDDRGRKPIGREVADADEEELEQYTVGVKRRIKELSHARHDERRAKEALIREREELERLTNKLVNENNQLRRYVSSGEQAYAGTLKSAAQAKLDMAKRKFKEAHEAFDADALVEAQAELNSAQLALMQAENFKPTPLQEETSVVETQYSQQAPVRPDDKTLRWQARNQWFGQDDEMTAVALAVHKKLVVSGIDPRSDEYFEQIDARVRTLFPDFFGATAQEKDSDERPVGAKKAATVVAPVKRTSGAKKITLTKTQVAIAKKLGVPLDVYAQHAQESQNG